MNHFSVALYVTSDNHRHT